MNDKQVDVLVYGDNCDSQIEDVQKYPGISKILVAKDAVLQNAYGDHMSKLTKALIDKNGYDKVISASSGFGKDVMPRLGGLMDT